MSFYFRSLTQCNICPRNCNVNRFNSSKGYCKTDYGLNINSIVVHHGEEPPISGNKGICNIFFQHCNMQCVFCQNHQISNNKSNTSKFHDFEQIILFITDKLESGCRTIGFVSPSHQIPQMLAIIDAFKYYHPKPVFVFNTNSYDKKEVIKDLEDKIDVYLADFKYFSDDLALKYSDTPNYAIISKAAIKEMLRQKGSQLHMNGVYAESGLIIRHLVMPGHVENSLNILRYLADNISIKVHISLMSQYHPSGFRPLPEEINRTLYEDEYGLVVEELERLGLENGWIQQLESPGHYLPDFDKENPF